MRLFLSSPAMGCMISLALAQAPQPEPQQPSPQQPPAPESAQPAPPAGQQTIQGRIVRVQGQDQFVVRSGDREMVFHANPQSRYLIRGAAGRFSDLQVGADVRVLYGTQDNRYYVNTVTVGEAAAAPQPGAQAPPAQPAPAPAQGTLVNGTVIRVVGQDQIVIKQENGQELTIYVTPQTRYSFDEKAGQFTDLRPGALIRADYELRDRRPVVRSIIGRRDR